MLTKQEKRMAELQAVLHAIAFYRERIRRLQAEYKDLLWEALDEAEMSE
jgi:hypothetical protein